MCTPEALAAYGGSAVFECLPEWINQRFMRVASDIGEDPAMTNMILKQGKKVLFKKNTIVIADLLEQYQRLYKMYIRWGRSNVSENLAIAKYVFVNFRKNLK